MAHHLAGLVFHGHDTRRMAQFTTPREGRLSGQQRAENRFIPVKDEVNLAVFVSRKHKARDNGRRPPVAAHGVNRNDESPRHLPGNSISGQFINRIFGDLAHASGHQIRAYAASSSRSTS